MTVVLQNLIFTHDAFTTTSVPFYSSSLGEGTTKWYAYHWWEYASDSLRILPPTLALVASNIGIAFKVQWMGAYIGTTAILLALEFLKLFKRAVDYVRCGSFQLCRNYDTSSLASPSSANSVFITEIFLTLAFVVIFAIYIGIFTYIESSLEAYAKKIEELKEKKADRDEEAEEDLRSKVINKKQKRYAETKYREIESRVRSESRGRTRSKSKSKK